jgi:hypothetical protein
VVNGKGKRVESLENPFPLSSDQEHRATLLVASASTDAEDCAFLLAVLGLRPAHRTAFDDPAG